MNQVATPASPATAALPVLTALLSGRVHATRKITTRTGPFHITVVKLPAPDEFSSPETVELRSKDKLGTQGDMVRCKVRIGGYGRSYQTTDPQDGDKVTVQTADNTLTVVE